MANKGCLLSLSKITCFELLPNKTSSSTNAYRLNNLGTIKMICITSFKYNWLNFCFAYKLPLYVTINVSSKFQIYMI